MEEVEAVGLRRIVVDECDRVAADGSRVVAGWSNSLAPAPDTNGSNCWMVLNARSSR
jgi:hypothetical protein